MNSVKRKIRFVLGFVGVIVGVAVFLVFAPYSHWIESDGSANVMMNVSDAEFTDSLEFSILPVENVFAYPGEKNKHVATLRFYSEKNSFRLRSFQLEIGGIDENDVSAIRMIDGDDRTHKGRLNDGYAQFKNLYIKSDVSEELVFDIYLDVSDNLKISDRFYLRLNRPEDLDVTINGNRVYPELEYPVLGSHISIIGKRVLF